MFSRNFGGKYLQKKSAFSWNLLVKKKIDVFAEFPGPKFVFRKRPFSRNFEVKLKIKNLKKNKK